MRPTAFSRSEFLLGARDTLPILLGVAPFGLVFGALALEAGLTPLEAQSFSLFVFAGSAQFVAVDLVRLGVSPLVIVFTIGVVNLRHMLYSASLAPLAARLPLRLRTVMAWLLTDEAFAVSSPRFRQPDLSGAQWYFLGSGMALWSVWQASTAGGILFGAAIPDNWSLDFALPLTFLAMLLPTLIDRPAWAAAISARRPGPRPAGPAARSGSGGVGGGGRRDRGRCRAAPQAHEGDVGMTAAEVGMVLVGGMALTYGIRLSFLLVPHPERFPEVFRRGLRLVAPAVLAAILIPQAIPELPWAGWAALARPMALAAAAAVGWRTRNTWLAIGSGMLALWLLQAWL